MCVCVCREKQQLEKELLKSMKMVDEINGVQDAPQEQGGGEQMVVETYSCPSVCLLRTILLSSIPHTRLLLTAVSAAVTDSWKFAAVEICSMLHQV